MTCGLLGRIAAGMGLTLLLLALPAPGVHAQTAPGLTPEPAVTARAVVQAISPAGVDVAAWSRDGQLIYAASGIGREFTIWDVAGGALLDRLRLPPAIGATVEYPHFTAMRLSPDGTRVTIDGVVFEPASFDGRAPRRYVIDLAKRQVRLIKPETLPPLPALPKGVTWDEELVRWLDALSATMGDPSSMSVEEAEQLLPALPASPDGRIRLKRAANGFLLIAQSGAQARLEMPDRMGSIGDAELSPDDRYLAILTLDDTPQSPGVPEARPETAPVDAGQPDRACPIPAADAQSRISPVEVLDLATSTFLPRLDAVGSYDRVHWLSRDRYVLMPRADADDPQSSAGAEECDPAKLLFVDAPSGRVEAEAPSLCFMAPLPDGRIVGAGLANCRSKVANDRRLMLLSGGVWRPLPGFQLPRGAEIRLIAPSPLGDRIAVVVRLPDKSLAVQIVNLDPASKAAAPRMEMEEGTELTLISFSPDGRQLWVAGEGTLMEWTIDAPGDQWKIRELPGEVLWPQRMATNGKRLIVGGSVDETVTMIDLAKGTGLPAVAWPGSVGLGYTRDGRAMWAASMINGVRFWDSRTGRILMTISLLPRSRYVAVSPDARYDTNSGPEVDAFRWVISDQLTRSLPPQTLMRDFYEPRMIDKLLACTRRGDCARALHPLPPLAGLNRQLPQVVIKPPRPAGPGRAVVEVEARETRDAATGVASGVYGVKLLMDNKEVARDPDDPARLPPTTLAGWRDANFTETLDPAGVRRWTFVVPIPSDGAPINFSAYSFNADRVKSDTAKVRWAPPPQPPRPRRAFVLTIGINDYAERRLNLSYAVPDAELIASRLATIPGFVVRQASLTSTPTRPVTQADVDFALGLLAGYEPPGMRARLAARGHDLSALEQTSPDDVVIISYSGHGFADAAGNFGLVPSDIEWPALASGPDPLGLIGADLLTFWLRRINAGEIALIIDACHSGAAVATPGFKPGPMGDPGLGQLAFDKGMRILAATQADDVAIETPRLSHGLLSAALGEGLTQTGGPADLDHDGKVRLDEWLRYAVARLPSLETEVRAGGGPVLSRGVKLVLRGELEGTSGQLPSLFDFTAKDSPVLLRGKP